ncbi:MAG: hypothetical protein IJW79_03825, partial [Clostridia bacterium]|nr:hypothetical protein [Clostridia bacterium]
IQYQYNITLCHFLDFEALSASGVDAIEVVASNSELRYALNGWDCDSILIMHRSFVYAKLWCFF